MDRGKTVQNLFEAYCRAYPLKSRHANQEASHGFWKSIKDKPDYDRLARSRIQELRSMAPSGTLKNFFPTVPVPNIPPSVTAPTPEPAPAIVAASPPDEEQQLSSSSKDPPPGKFACPKPDSLKKELEAVTAEICSLLLRERNGIISSHQSKALKKLQKKKAEIEADLKRLRYDQDRQKHFRIQRKRALDDACQSNPGLAKQLRKRKEVGRPNIELDQPQFIRTLLDIAQHGASADARRRFDLH